MRKNTAFSLIELSIVILIIGVLISAMASGSIMVKKAHLRTAQSLTNSSAVSSIDGLTLWLETTRAESFDHFETKDGDTVTMWHATNDQKRKPLHAVNLSGSSAITYQKYSDINDLPSLNFNGTTQSLLQLSTDPETLSAASINTKHNAFTLFLVFKTDTVGSEQHIFYNGTSGTNGSGASYLSTNKIRLDVPAGDILGNNIILNNKPTILLVSHQGGTSGDIEIFINGLSNAGVEYLDNDNAATTTTIQYPTGGFFIGFRNAATAGSNQFSGLISEIIIFDHALPLKEAQAVEKYLSQKYKIAILQAA